MTAKLILKLVLLGLYGPALLFLASGDLGWIEGWAYGVFAVAYTVLGRLALFAKTPDLAAERASGMSRPDVAPWDRVLVPWIALILPTLTMIAAGLDRRLGGAPHFPVWIEAAAAVPMVAGAWLGLAAALKNPFFSSVARLQPDRGQVVVASGPYRLVRHPGYAGGIVFNVFTPFALGSTWALLPSGLIIGLTILRTHLEDRMLREGLEGYRDYAARTRYRLIPRLW